MLRAAPREQRLQLALGLPLRNQDELDALLPQLSDPASPNFHKYLLPEEFAARFGPSEEDYAALIQFAQANGLAVTHTHANRGVLSVEGAMQDVEQAFQVKMMTYQHPARGVFVAPDREPMLPGAGGAMTVMGLDNFAPPTPMNVTKMAVARANSGVGGSGPAGYLIGKDFRAAYAPGVTLTGAGQTVGLLEFDGFFPGDVVKNFAAAGLPPVPTQTVLVDGVNGSANGANIEVILDIMMAAYMAPGLQKIIVYEGAVPNDVLNRMATDNLAQQLSSSWGWGGINATTEQIFKQYIAQGQSYMQASGDSGAYTGKVMPPADDPSVTVVGGTSLTTNGPGGAWLSETTWSGSGGGVSTVYPIPSYQLGVAMASRKGSTTMRNLPDVALTADIQMYLIYNNGSATAVGGTSAAAPLWAGFMALANQQATANGKPRIGFLNPLIYAIGGSGNFGADLHDITTGSNGFVAVGGYDLATGWGSPAGQKLIDDLAGASTAVPSFTLAAAPGALTVIAGASSTATVTVGAAGGFSGVVTMSATGLPAGITAVFGTGTGTRTATFSVGATAVAGTSNVTISGVSVTLKASTTIVLTVQAQSFKVSVAPGLLTLPAGGSAVGTVTVGAVNGFNGSVAFTATGIPAGITAVFGTPGSTGARSVTFSATSAAAASSFTATIAGVSGALKASAAVAVTVVVPGFTLAFQPGTLGVPSGAKVAGMLAITATNGFNGGMVFSATGQPAGMTVSFGLPANGLVAVSFVSAAGQVAGTYSVTLTGVSGKLMQSVKLMLTLTAAGTGARFVDLAPSYNVMGMAVDGVAFTGAGLDGGLNGTSTAYSGNLLGTGITVGGTSFYFGPAGVLDAVSGMVVALSAGQFTALKLLATAVNGSQAAQVFRVTYTDGTSTVLVQGVSDWFAPGIFAGETRALAMGHRDTGTGAVDSRSFNLSAYSLPLNPAKTVASLTLPNNRNVVVLAATLTGATAKTSGGVVAGVGR